jgi:hypothetical protein
MWSSGEEFNLQNPKAISSSGKQKQIIAEMDGERALMPIGLVHQMARSHLQDLP